MRSLSVAADILVIAGALMLAAAGFFLDTSLGLAVSGIMCLAMGVGVVRTRERKGRQ